MSNKLWYKAGFFVLFFEMNHEVQNLHFLNCIKHRNLRFSLYVHDTNSSNICFTHQSKHSAFYFVADISSPAQFETYILIEN